MKARIGFEFCVVSALWCGGVVSRDGSSGEQTVQQYHYLQFSDATKQSGVVYFNDAKEFKGISAGALNMKNKNGVDLQQLGLNVDEKKGEDMKGASKGIGVKSNSGSFLDKRESVDMNQYEYVNTGIMEKEYKNTGRTELGTVVGEVLVKRGSESVTKEEFKVAVERYMNNGAPPVPIYKNNNEAKDFIDEIRNAELMKLMERKIKLNNVFEQTEAVYKILLRLDRLNDVKVNYLDHVAFNSQERLCTKNVMEMIEELLKQKNINDVNFAALKSKIDAQGENFKNQRNVFSADFLTGMDIDFSTYLVTFEEITNCPTQIKGIIGSITELTNVRRSVILIAKLYRDEVSFFVNSNISSMMDKYMDSIILGKFQEQLDECNGSISFLRIPQSFQETPSSVRFLSKEQRETEGLGSAVAEFDDIVYPLYRAFSRPVGAERNCDDIYEYFLWVGFNRIFDSNTPMESGFSALINNYMNAFEIDKPKKQLLVLKDILTRNRKKVFENALYLDETLYQFKGGNKNDRVLGSILNDKKTRINKVTLDTFRKEVALYKDARLLQEFLNEYIDLKQESDGLDVNCAATKVDLLNTLKEFTSQTTMDKQTAAMKAAKKIVELGMFEGEINRICKKIEIFKVKYDLGGENTPLLANIRKIVNMAGLYCYRDKYKFITVIGEWIDIAGLRDFDSVFDGYRALLKSNTTLETIQKSGKKLSRLYELKSKKRFKDIIKDTALDVLHDEKEYFSTDNLKKFRSNLVYNSENLKKNDFKLENIFDFVANGLDSDIAKSFDEKHNEYLKCEIDSLDGEPDASKCEKELQLFNEEYGKIDSEIKLFDGAFGEGSVQGDSYKRIKEKSDKAKELRSIYEKHKNLVCDWKQYVSYLEESDNKKQLSAKLLDQPTGIVTNAKKILDVISKFPEHKLETLKSRVTDIREAASDISEKGEALLANLVSNNARLTDYKTALKEIAKNIDGTKFYNGDGKPETTKIQTLIKLISKANTEFEKMSDLNENNRRFVYAVKKYEECVKKSLKFKVDLKNKLDYFISNVKKYNGLKEVNQGLKSFNSVLSKLVALGNLDLHTQLKELETALTTFIECTDDKKTECATIVENAITSMENSLDLVFDLENDISKLSGKDITYNDNNESVKIISFGEIINGITKYINNIKDDTFNVLETVFKQNVANYKELQEGKKEVILGMYKLCYSLGLLVGRINDKQLGDMEFYKQLDEMYKKLGKYYDDYLNDPEFSEPLGENEKWVLLDSEPYGQFSKNIELLLKNCYLKLINLQERIKNSVANVLDKQVDDLYNDFDIDDNVDIDNIDDYIYNSINGSQRTFSDGPVKDIKNEPKTPVTIDDDITHIHYEYTLNNGSQQTFNEGLVKDIKNTLQPLSYTWKFESTIQSNSACLMGNMINNAKIKSILNKYLKLYTELLEYDTMDDLRKKNEKILGQKSESDINQLYQFKHDLIKAKYYYTTISNMATQIDEKVKDYKNCAGFEKYFNDHIESTTLNTSFKELENKISENSKTITNNKNEINELIKKVEQEIGKNPVRVEKSVENKITSLPLTPSDIFDDINKELLDAKLDNEDINSDKKNEIALVNSIQNKFNSTVGKIKSSNSEKSVRNIAEVIIKHRYHDSQLLRIQDFDQTNFMEFILNLSKDGNKGFISSALTNEIKPIFTYIKNPGDLLERLEKLSELNRSYYNENKIIIMKDIGDLVTFYKKNNPIFISLLTLYGDIIPSGIKPIFNDMGRALAICNQIIQVVNGIMDELSHIYSEIDQFTKKIESNLMEKYGQRRNIDPFKADQSRIVRLGSLLKKIKKILFIEGGRMNQPDLDVRFDDNDLQNDVDVSQTAVNNYQSSFESYLGNFDKLEKAVENTAKKIPELITFGNSLIDGTEATAPKPLKLDYSNIVQGYELALTSLQKALAGFSNNPTYYSNNQSSIQNYISTAKDYMKILEFGKYHDSLLEIMDQITQNISNAEKEILDVDTNCKTIKESIETKSKEDVKIALNKLQISRNELLKIKHKVKERENEFKELITNINNYFSQINSISAERVSKILSLLSNLTNVLNNIKDKLSKTIKNMESKIKEADELYGINITLPFLDISNENIQVSIPSEPPNYSVQSSTDFEEKINSARSLCTTLFNNPETLKSLNINMPQAQSKAVEYYHQLIKRKFELYKDKLVDLLPYCEDCGALLKSVSGELESYKTLGNNDIKVNYTTLNNINGQLDAIKIMVAENFSELLLRDNILRSGLSHGTFTSSFIKRQGAQPLLKPRSSPKDISTLLKDMPTVASIQVVSDYSNRLKKLHSISNDYNKLHDKVVLDLHQADILVQKINYYNSLNELPNQPEKDLDMDIHASKTLLQKTSSRISNLAIEVRSTRDELAQNYKPPANQNQLDSFISKQKAEFLQAYDSRLDEIKHFNSSIASSLKEITTIRPVPLNAALKPTTYSYYPFYLIFFALFLIFI
ncbi:hypothetical protein AX774_g2083 [Zancudomyces culisetae]|uniref:Uncharacterized protein n=1 Tax=Zancudomyces culisetae TaxID=1213189 RepID=A0A1R1PTW1_ZANCU|nr:hypothetical protein AX774_g2083 [Zancudomyces culisetae]|eukprot:OMH84387.1 hypothetical protein AX774_g2083 [Zancudomyces culisetae]